MTVIEMRAEFRRTRLAWAKALVDIQLLLAEATACDDEWLFWKWLEDHLGDVDVVAEIMGGGLAEIRAAYYKRLRALDAELGDTLCG